MKRTKTKRIQPSFLVFVLLFAFLLCSCRQGISQSPEQTEAQIQKGENPPTTKESKTVEERLFEEWMPFCKISRTHALEGMSYRQLTITYNILAEKILDTEEILPEHLKEAEEIFHRLERFQNATEKTDYSLVDTLFPGKPNTYLYIEKNGLWDIKFLQQVLQEILKKDYDQFEKYNEFWVRWDRNYHREEIKIPELDDPELEALEEAIYDLREYDEETETTQTYSSFQHDFIFFKAFKLEKRLEATDEGRKLLEQYRKENPWKGENIDALLEFETTVNKNDYKEKN